MKSCGKAAVFHSADIWPLIEHARRCERHEPSPDQMLDSHYRQDGHEAVDEHRIPPGLHLISNICVHLKSNGLPWQGATVRNDPDVVFAERLDLTPMTGRQRAANSRGTGEICEFIALEEIEPVLRNHPHVFIRFRDGNIEIGGC